MVLWPVPVLTVRFQVPASLTADGGGLRLRHGLGGPVTVVAYGPADPAVERERIGYLFATPIDDDVEHIELVPGARALVVTRDEDEVQP